MQYTLYEIISIEEFEKNGTATMTIDFTTAERGDLSVTVYKNIFFSLVYEGAFLPIGLNGHNPFLKNDLAAYEKDGVLYLGFKNEN